MATEAEKAPKVEKTNRRAANETRKEGGVACPVGAWLT